MNISIEPLNKGNWYTVCQLSVSDEQKQVFPISNVYWIGISRYEEHTELFAIKRDDVYAGFACIEIVENNLHLFRKNITVIVDSSFLLDIINTKR